MEDDTMEGGAGRQSVTVMPSRTPTAVHGSAWTGRVPHVLPSPVPDALGSGVYVSSNHCGTHIAIVEGVAALSGLAVDGKHEHELALVVDCGGAHNTNVAMTVISLFCLFSVSMTLYPVSACLRRLSSTCAEEVDVTGSGTVSAVAHCQCVVVALARST